MAVTDERRRPSGNHPLLNVPNEVRKRTGEVGLRLAASTSPSGLGGGTRRSSLCDPGEERFHFSPPGMVKGATPTSLIYYFQLENLVPGAYRMFANFIASTTGSKSLGLGTKLP